MYSKSNWKKCSSIFFWDIGQLFSKCFFGVFNSPKKLTKTIRLEVVKSNVFVRFLGELKIPKRDFEIYWPLAIAWNLKKYLIKAKRHEIKAHPTINFTSLCSAVKFSWLLFFTFQAFYALLRNVAGTILEMIFDTYYCENMVFPTGDRSTI